MPTDPAILAQLQTLWGEPVTKTTTEADAASAFVASEFLPSPIPPTRLVDSPGTWNTEAAEPATQTRRFARRQRLGVASASPNLSFETAPEPRRNRAGRTLNFRRGCFFAAQTEARLCRSRSSAETG